MTKVRVIAALLRVSFAEAAAYRAESFIWLLATTMPLVMLSLFVAVAKDGPVGRFDEAHFVSYFLCTFLVRTTTGSWASWQVNMDIRDGTLAVKLLRPVPPLWSYVTDNLAALPLRSFLCVPMAVLLLVSTGSGALPRDPVLWLLWALSMVGTWLFNILTNLAVGCLAFFMESSLKVMDLYIALFFLLSGYLIPLDIFPPRVTTILSYLPFHFQLGLPVEIMTSAYDRGGALRLIGLQYGYVAATFALTVTLFHRGIRRFAAYGG